ncbi:MAG: uracil-DNA glycosylase [Eubacteriales bacterium]|nr:uracil-DNA glycosylase [Eubacteriales bacterium]
MTEWEELIQKCTKCKKCELHNSRKNVVVGRGNVNAPVMLIGEGPGEQEDIQGIPFIGAAGRLLDVLLNSLMLGEKDYYITNIVKCRPPSNRIPTDEEAYACMPYLRDQFTLVKPKIIVCLGATAVKYIIDRKAKITAIRGNWQEQKGIFVMPTFHPAALLRDPSKKPLMFSDMKSVREKLESMK